MLTLKEHLELKNNATKLGACERVRRTWNFPTDAELMEMYKKNIDFILKHDFPTLHYIKRHFNPEEMHRHGIWQGEEVTGKSDFMVLNGSCTGTIRFTDYDVATVYVRHTSKVTIIISKFARVKIGIYDRAEVKVKNEGYIPQFIYVYSPNAMLGQMGGKFNLRHNFKKYPDKV